MKPRSRPQMIGELLDGARVVSAERGKVAIDRHTWRRLLGDRVARRTEPGSLVGGVLTIYVASAPWAQELSLLTHELMERLKPLGLQISSMRFRVRQQIHASAASPKRRPAARVALPSELQARVDSVEDPELRQVIADAAELWLGRVAKQQAKSQGQRSSSATGSSLGQRAPRPGSAERRRLGGGSAELTSTEKSATARRPFSQVAGSSGRQSDRRSNARSGAPDLRSSAAQTDRSERSSPQRPSAAPSTNGSPKPSRR